MSGNDDEGSGWSRRAFLTAGAATAGAALGSKLLEPVRAASNPNGKHPHAGMRPVGSTRTDDFDPYAFLTDFNWGDEVIDNGDGTKTRIYRITASDIEIEVAPGVTFNAWAYNGQVPGPTLRAREGDTIQIEFQNAGSHPHTIHFHGIHGASQDGVPGAGDGMIDQGESTTYTFPAEPWGVHLYHCHSVPLKRHIHKGLYGAYIVDPREPLDPTVSDPWGTEVENELVMVMNGFDTNFDGDNEIYAVNTKAFCYAERPIRITRGKRQRVFLVNATEFDAVNSFHLHGNFFDFWQMGRKDNPKIFHDTISMVQAQRGLLEFTFDTEPGKYMFHAHQSEFAELGWMSFFDVVEDDGTPTDPVTPPVPHTPAPVDDGGLLG